MTAEQHHHIGSQNRILILAALACSILSAAAQDGLVGKWTFQTDRFTGVTVEDISGVLDGEVVGPFVLSSDPEALFLDGAQNYVRMSSSLDPALLPVRNLTVEAWVTLEASTRWGGIVGCIQDNGSFEKGWLLGYDDTGFNMALSTAGTLTYLASSSPFVLNRWYHVVGTYDGTTLKLYVNGAQVASSTAQNGPIDYAPAPYVIGAYQDDNELYPMHGGVHEVCVYDRTLNAAEVTARYNAKKAIFPATVDPPGSGSETLLALGPYAQFTAEDEVTIFWHTAEDCPSVVEFGVSPLLGTRVEDSTPKRNHELTIPDLTADRSYYYKVVQTIVQASTSTQTYELDPSFNLAVRRPPQIPSPFPEDGLTSFYAELAQSILDSTGIKKGYCLDYGCGDGRLAYELAIRSNLHVIGVSENAAGVATARKALQQAGLYGTRVSFIQSSLDHLPHAKDSFTLVVSSELFSSATVPGQASEILRLLRPAGGTAVLGYPPGSSATLPNWAALDQWVRDGITGSDATIEANPNLGITVSRNPLPGVGEWSHMFGDPAQTANSHDQRVRGRDMKLQWFGRPGPRGVVDRGARNPSPLAVNGFMIVPGNDRIWGVDGYNGTINWTLEIPGMRRVNMPRDSSYMCADDQSVYLAVRNKCWRLDNLSGRLTQDYDIVPPGGSYSYDWGYVANIDDRLYGTSVKKGSAYTAYDGPAFWYDTLGLGSTAKVCSDNFFCRSKSTGQTVWSYQNGVIINSSIVIGGGRVYFVESRDATAKSQPTGRIGDSSLWDNQYLVALDAGTGSLIWEQPVSFPSSPYPIVFFMSYADEKLVVDVSTSRYDLLAFSAQNGQLLWQKNHSWARDNHGGHMYHPVIVQGVVYLEPNGYDLTTGAVVKTGLPSRGGCHTMSAAENTFLYVNWDYDKGSMYFWDLDTDQRRQMAGSRSSCWLSYISGSGMVLAPTASSGCTCRYPLQTSLGFSAP